MISEHSVSKGLRHTLVVQAQRLERLAANRLAEFLDEPDDSDFDEPNGESNPHLEKKGED